MIDCRLGSFRQLAEAAYSRPTTPNFNHFVISWSKIAISNYLLAAQPAKTCIQYPCIYSYTLFFRFDTSRPRQPPTYGGTRDPQVSSWAQGAPGGFPTCKLPCFATNPWTNPGAAQETPFLPSWDSLVLRADGRRRPICLSSGHHGCFTQDADRPTRPTPQEKD